ncbi:MULTISPECIES: sulfurtransferase complex subunit TusD [Nitrincola]|uniref:Putative sulfurtransferase DsrE n=1 Tax=Nitrincola nitratireducens TaxID=1229521 RepID=W9VLG8_9GAMM|nr:MULTISPECIES: sulfurtransferase complex subunit TusD [Nitrincola]EXJ11375.1 Putative sulfurtransferase DsrE [Nitrincola nitratireducens]
MIFTVVVHASPCQNAAPESALRFCKALLSAGHTLHRVFFYRDGVFNGNQLISSPPDELNTMRAWQALAEEHSIDLVICIAAAIRRGVLDSTEAKRYEQNQTNLAEKFNLSGLGQLVEACILSDRVITFGGQG